MSIRLRIAILAVGGLVAGAAAVYLFWLPRPNQQVAMHIPADPSFGWKIPADQFTRTISGNRITFSRSDAHSNIRTPGGDPLGLPVRLKIPSIGVNSAIEDAALTPDGKMDMPTGSVNVAWFALGPPPGAVGSAVIGGHFGINSGVPFVFYNLDKLKTGDKVYIEDDTGHTYAFVVRTTRLFDRNADATTVFTSTDGQAHLNLVTCEGIWNKANGLYPDRRVVFADAIASEGPVAVAPVFSATLQPKPSASAVQTPLTPSPTPNGFMQSVKGLFASPLGGFITILLVGVIGYVVFKIFRQ